MKSLVIFYSLTGNCRFIGKTIAKALGSDILELKTKENIPETGLKKYFRGGKAVFRKETPDLLDFDKNIYDYDLLFIGTPVWAFTYAPALRTLFSRYVIKHKKIALFCCHGGGKGKTFENMEKKLYGNTILGKFDVMEPLRFNRKLNQKKAEQWAKQMSGPVSL